MTFPRNKTLILTGASRGIGKALALALAREGVRLALNARDGDALEQARAECEAAGTRAVAVAGNAAREETVRALVDAAQGLGGYHGFIHVAGVLAPGPNVWELPPETFAEIMDSHMVAAWQLIRLAAPPLIAQGSGLAVFFGSGASEIAQPGIGVYCAAKAAEESLARQLAAEAPQLTSFIYRPGIVETRMQVQARLSEGGAAKQLRAVFRPWKEQGLLITPEQAAGGLMRILHAGADRHHGRVADIREL